MRIIFVLAIAVTLMTGISGCSLTGSDSTTTNSIVTAIDNVIDVALPIASQLGVIAAQEYVGNMVSEGKITSEQASAINTALATAAASLSSDKAPTLKKSFWKLTSTSEQIKKSVHTQLGY